MSSPEQRQYKLPNELIDACVVYGLDGNSCESLQTRYSNSKDLYSDLISTEIAPQIMTIITATHQAREQCELAAAEKSINLPEGIINSLGQHLFPDGSKIVDKPPAATLISTKKRIHDHCVHCTGFNFYQSYILVKNDDKTFSFDPCSTNGDVSEDKKLIFLPTCIMLMSRSPLYHVQKEILSCFFQKFMSEEEDTPLLDAVADFAKQLFRIPIPPHGRIAVEFHLLGVNICLSPPKSEFGHLDTRLNYPFISLSIDNVFAVMSAILTEQRILFLCSSYTVLAYNIECFLIYIGPFEWHHTCIPVLSACELDTCKGSESFIVGCKKNRSLPSDVVSNVKNLVVVDLDTDEILYKNFPAGSQYGIHVPSVPQQAVEEFKERYSALPQHYDLSVVDRLAHVTAKDHIHERRRFEYQTDFKLLALFQYFMAVVFDELIHLPSNVSVEECDTYRHAGPYEQRFYKAFCSTKMFLKTLAKRRNKAVHDSFTRLCDIHRRSRRKNFDVQTDTIFNASSSPVTRRRRVASTGQMSNRISQSAKHNSSFNSSGTKANKMDANAVDGFRRCKSIATETVDTNDIGSHHILEMPSLLEPKGTFFGKVIDHLTRIIEESGNLIDSSLKAPAIYLRACSKFANGKCLEGFDDFGVLSTHSIQLLPDQRMIREMLSMLSEKELAILKTKPYWSMFSPKHQLKKCFQNQAEQQIADLEVYIPVNPLTKEQFVATMLHNKIVSHTETATRLFETLEHDQTGRLLPEELELFYDSWRNIVTMNKHAQTVAAYKTVERVLVYYHDSKLLTSSGIGYLILTSYRLLVKVNLETNTLCDLKLPDWKVIKCNISKDGHARPAISFQSTSNSTSGSPPYVSFGDGSIRDLWYRVVKELLSGMCLVLAKKDVNFMQQAENNIIIFNSIFYSPLRCRSSLLKDPSPILHLSTKATTTIPETSVNHSFKLLQRINPSQNETSQATIGCALYIPSGLCTEDQSGKLWFGLGNGLLKVYSMGYQLQSDQLAHKIVSSTRSRGARLTHFLLVHDTVWALTSRSIVIIDADTNSVISQLASGLEDDPVTLVLSHTEPSVVWSLLANGTVIAWNPFTREKINSVKVSLRSKSSDDGIPCIFTSMLAWQDQLWIGTNKGRIILLKSETLEVLQEIEVLEGKNCQIRSMVLSNNGQVWCCTYRPNFLKVINPTSHEVVFTYDELEQGTSVILPVDNCQVWCGLKNGNILIFKDGEKIKYYSSIKAHDDTIHSLVATEDGLVVSGSGSMDGSAALWMSTPIKTMCIP